MVLIHVAALLVTLYFIFRADTLAFSWMRGERQTLDLKDVRKLHWIVSIGLAVLIVTGGLMFLGRSTRLLNNPAFIAKMVFVVFLVINSVVIHFLMNIAETRTYKSLSNKEKYPLLISGAVSTIGWLGAIVSAAFL
jgi:uncharacterized membrane protein